MIDLLLVFCLRVVILALVELRVFPVYDLCVEVLGVLLLGWERKAATNTCFVALALQEFDNELARSKSFTALTPLSLTFIF